MKQQASSIHDAVRETYAAHARSGSSCCGPSNSNLIYPEELMTGLPKDVANFSLGCGNPISVAAMQPGETVLDLGSGGGLDCFLSAKQVGESGRVIGVDMTPEMIQRARLNAGRMGVKNVEFREGFLESLPLEDNSVDVGHFELRHQPFAGQAQGFQGSFPCAQAGRTGGRLGYRHQRAAA